MLRESDIITVLTHRPTVSENHRGTGLGALLLDAVVHHPDLANVRSLELICQPDLIPFYRHWGFTDQVGHSLLMRRTTDLRLTTDA
jgi:predicted GNAT family N-acyltransferase